MSHHSPLTTHRSPTPWRVAIIGGGITGLAAAHRLQELCQQANRPLELTLFESGPRLGGVVGTCRIGDYLVETGADSFITNKPWAVDLCRRLGLEDRLIPTDPAYRRSLVLHNGKPVPVPEGFMLLSPARMWPVLTSPIFSLRGKVRLGWEYFVRPRTDNGDESLASFVRRRFGQEALERLVQPLVGGIYTSDPERLSLQATMPRFLEQERQFGSLIRAMRKQKPQRLSAETQGSGARYGMFATLAGGISELVDTLAARVSQTGRIWLDTTLTTLARRRQDGPFQLTVTATSESCVAEFIRNRSVDLTARIVSNSATEEFDAVILAVPAYHAAFLLEQIDQPLAAVLSEIEYASSAIVVTGHNLADIRHPLEAFGLVIPAIENRRLLAVSFASRKFPSRAPAGKVLLRTFVGGALQPELLTRSDEELIALVRAELADLLGVTGREDFARVCRYHRAMPQYHVGHLDRVARIEQLLSQHPGLQLAGNAYHGVGLPDCIHSGETAAERLAALS
jgi:oxygen-dependent protoporphyrinogen oxidase